MNKRGSVEILHEAVRALPAMVLVLVLLYAGVKIYNATHPEQFSVEKKDLRRIVAEIKDLKNDEVITVPLFSQNYKLKALRTATPEQKAAYFGCSMDYCVCFMKDNTLVACEPFNLKVEFDPEKDCINEMIIYPNPTEVSANKSVSIKRIEPCKVQISGGKLDYGNFDGTGGGVPSGQK